MKEIGSLDARDRQPPDASVGAHEVSHESGRRPSEHFARGVVLLQDAALRQDGDAIPELRGLFDVVGDEHDGLLQLCLQVEELLLQPLPGDGVDRAEGLVHQQDRRIATESPGDTDALTLPTGELVRETPPVLIGVQPDQVEQLLHPGVHPGAVPAEKAGHRRDVVRHAPMGEEPTLLDHVADVPAQDGPGRASGRPSRR